MHPKAQRTSRPCPAGLGRALERQRVLLGLAALAFAACAGAQLTVEQIKALPGCESADAATYSAQAALPACSSWLKAPKSLACPAECAQGLNALGVDCLAAVTTYEWQQTLPNMPPNVTKYYAQAMLGACTNGTASSVDASQVLDVLKYMDTPSCASANLPGALSADCNMDTLLGALQSGKNCTAACTVFITSIGLDCLSDAVLQAFNETQPGMMGFSEDTVRQLIRGVLSPCAGNTTAASATPVSPASGGTAQASPEPTPTPATNGTSEATNGTTVGGGGGGGSNTGAAVGAAVGAVAAVAVASVLAFILYRRWRRRQRAVDEAGKSGPAGLAAQSLGPAGSGSSGGGYGPGPGGGSGPGGSLASMQAEATVAGAALPQYLGSDGSAGDTPRSTLLPLTSSAPATPTMPSTSLRSGASAEVPPSLSRDPLLSYLSSQVAPRPSGAASSPGLAGVDVRQWEVQFNELQMKRPVGEGSFGKVYLASWFGTEVAVKILIVGHVASASEAQRALSLSAPIMQKLEAEASLLASLRHPHVVNFLGICHEPPCIVTEFCARGSLCDLLAAARSDPEVAAQLSWCRRLTMAADAAAGMLYLHSRSSPAPIIHRDLKSPNLLVDANWSVKVTDFNLSKILEDTTHSTSMAAMNPRWLAPEVMRGGRATKASDVYSFGIVLWELLTWQLPFGPANPWHLVAHVLAGGRLDVPAIDALPGPDTAAFGGGGLEGYLALMQRCWAQVSEQRPGFQQVVRELRALLELAPPEQQ